MLPTMRAEKMFCHKNCVVIDKSIVVADDRLLNIRPINTKYVY